MSEGKVAISYVVNNSEFNSNIAQMKKNLLLLQTEVKNSAKEVNQYGSNIQTLSKKQESINNAINQTKKIMDTYNTSLEKNKKSLASNQEELAKLTTKKKQINSQYKEAVKVYGEESEQAKELQARLEEVASEYDKMSNKIKSNKNNITNYIAQIEKQRSSLIDLEVQLQEVNKEIEEQTNKFLNASKSFAKASGALESFGGKTSDLGGSLLTLSAPLLAFGAYSTSVGKTFKKNMSVVQGTANLSSDEISTLSERAKELGESIRGANATDIAASYQYLALAGQSVAEMYETIEPYTKAAIAYGEDQKTVTDLGTDSMSALGLATEQTSYYLDVLTKAQNSSNTTATQLMEAYIECGGTLKNMNVPLEESTALLGRMADQGLKGSQAGNSLNSILINLMGTTSTTEGALKKLGVSSYDAEGNFRGLKTVLEDVCESASQMTDEQSDLTLALLGGKTQITALNALLNGQSEGYDKLYNSLLNAEGAMDKMYETMSNNTQGNIDEMKSKLEALGLTFSDNILPYVNKFIDKTKELIDWFGSLSEENQQLIVDLGLITACTGGALKVVGKFTTQLGGVVKTGGKALEWVSKFTKTTSIVETAVTGATKSVTVLSDGLGILSGIKMTSLVSGLGAVSLAIGAAGVTWKEYNDVMHSSVVKAKEDYSVLELAITKLLGINVKTKDELIESKLMYDDWGDKVSETTQETLNTTVQNIHEINLAIQSANFDGILTEEEISGVQQKVKNFCQTIISTIEANQSDTYQAMYNLFNIDGIIDEQEQTVLDSMNGNTNEMIQGVQERAERINQIMITAKENNVQITEEENNEIQTLLNEMGKLQIDALNATAEEKFQANRGYWDRIHVQDSEELSKILVQANEEKESQLAAIREKYDAMIEEAEIGLKNLSGKELELAEQKLQQVKEQRDKEIEIEQKLWDDKISMAEENYGTQMDIINRYNGELLTNEDLAAQERLSNLQSQYEDMKYATESGWYQIKNTVNGELSDVYIEVDKNTGNIVGAFDSMNGTVGGYTEDMSKKIKELGKTNESTLNTLKSNIGDASNIWVDKSRNIVNANGDVISSLKDVKLKADGTKEALIDIDGRSFKIEVDTSGAITKISNLSTDLSALRNQLNNLGLSDLKVSGVTSPGGATQITGYETGGVVNKSGIYTINEAGVELVDSFSGVENYTLADAVRGEYAYLQKGSKVTNATMTTQKMSDMIDNKLNITLGSYLKEMNKILSKQSSSNETRIHIDQAHFENKQTETQTINNVKRILNSLK